MLKQGVHEQFVMNTDDTGRFVVHSLRTGRDYYVEPIGDPHRKWGSVDPASKDLMVKKAWKKYRGSIDEQESLITEDNGFSNVRTLAPGTSPLAVIQHVDSQYPDKQ